MTLQSSGEISLANVQTEFGGSNPIGINEYYGVASGVPASGAISLANFYGTSAVNFWAIGEQDSASGIEGGCYFISGGTFTSANITATSTGSKTLSFTFTENSANVIEGATSYIRLYKNSSQIFQFTRSEGLTTTYSASYNSGDVFYFQTELGVNNCGGSNPGIGTIQVNTGSDLVYRYTMTSAND